MFHILTMYANNIPIARIKEIVKKRGLTADTTAEQFVEEHKNDTYEQLAIIKNKLIKDIEYLTKWFGETDDRIKPTPEEIYRNEREYLIAIEPLLDKKFIQEYIEN